MLVGVGTSWSTTGPGGRAGRQHLQLHRRGEGGVDRRDPRPLALQTGRPREPPDRHRPPRRALRNGAARACRGRRLRRHRRLHGAAEAAGRGRAAPTYVGAARAAAVRRAAHPGDAVLHVVPEDRRGLQPHLLVLHHPEDPRTAGEPRHRVAGGRGAPPRRFGRPRAQPDRAGPDQLRHRPRRRREPRAASRRCSRSTASSGSVCCTCTRSTSPTSCCV